MLNRAQPFSYSTSNKIKCILIIGSALDKHCVGSTEKTFHWEFPGIFAPEYLENLQEILVMVSELRTNASELTLLLIITILHILI